jgi:two-component system, chemotaxis family, protein-glutamate methylesterase/glutaminase
MAKRDIIVVGASAGGLTALKAFVSSLPSDFKGSVFVVLHIPPHVKTMLPAILSRSGLLKAVQPKDGEPIEEGKIYVAANDHHLLIEDDKVVIKRGPKENRFRPSIDALFRSAAYNYGPRVIGIVLSGLLNDGTSGLWTIKRMGGTAIIQEPEDAEFPQMPENVLEYVEVDYSVPASEMGGLLEKLVKKPAGKKVKLSKEQMKLLQMEVIIATRDNAFEMGIIEMGELTPFTCPECHGSLVRLVQGKLIRFRCHTGHAFTASALLAEVTQSVEEMLWQGMRGMEETAMLLRSIEKHFKEFGDHKTATLFADKAEEASHRARIIHDSVFRQEQYSEDIRHEKRLPKSKRNVKRS